MLQAAEAAAPCRAPGNGEPTTIAVVVIAYNRPVYLNRALASVMKHHPGEDKFDVYVSQDGENDAVKEVIVKHKAHRLVHPRRELVLPAKSFLKQVPGYAYLSVHYGWALTTIFERVREDGSKYEGVIILEEDIEERRLAKPS
jgi:alpha-1,3-mannosyl-glycoprotein beta-1,2-N-acetylglucosaminyltransferase